MFVNLETNKGTLQFVAYNEHNGHYGHEAKVTCKQLACEIFAFDALIQNPDRRMDKPNILWKGEELYIIDHEKGFSFVYALPASIKPWQVNEISFLEKPFVLSKLKRKRYKS